MSTLRGLFSETSARVEREEKRDGRETERREIPGKKRCWKRQPKEQGTILFPTTFPRRLSRRGRRREREEGRMIRRGEMSDDTEGTKGLRPIVVQSDAVDGQANLYSSGLTLSLLHEMLWRENLKELVL